MSHLNLSAVDKAVLFSIYLATGKKLGRIAIDQDILNLVFGRILDNDVKKAFRNLTKKNLVIRNSVNKIYGYSLTQEGLLAAHDP